jgi:hypothetical protein
MDFETHLTLEELSDLLDAHLSSAARRPVHEHLECCSACTDRLSRLQGLLREARKLPDMVEPPGAIWHGVHAHIQPAAKRSRRLWPLAAAAVILVTLSSGITALLMTPATSVVLKSEGPRVPSTSRTPQVPARSIDADYAAAIRELSQTLAQHRDQLDPATIAKVEASLTIVDSAIAEARRALTADPVSPTLLDILSANYQRKVELLRRANTLAPST